MGRGTGTYAESAARSVPRTRQTEALLWGGKAVCKPVFVDELKTEICAYQNGGPAFAAESEAQLPRGTVFLGRYRLIKPLGPDTPVYVAVS